MARQVKPMDYSYGNQGPQNRLFAEPTPGPDPTSFQVDNTSESYYKSPYFLAHLNQVQPVPQPRSSAPRLDLSDVIGKDAIDQMQNAGRIAFHAVGDTGAAKVDRNQSVASAIAKEDSVADALAADLKAGGPGAPSFFFHLGDVVYSFGEAQYYHDQFYDPYRAYDRPIFAIPGNHDGMVFGSSLSGPQVPSLEAFLRNFCAAQPGPSTDSGGLVRSVMTQPGVYFTLDAPFVSIIGLYSNVLEGPGVISSQGGHFPIVGDTQLEFLKGELQRLKPDHDAQKRAVIIAVHHPPTSADSKHGGTVGLSKDIDDCCVAAGLWPDAVLSGHAHLYQRFSRTVEGLNREIPYVTSGSGGYAATPPRSGAVANTVDGPFRLVTAPVMEFGYLTVTVEKVTLKGKDLLQLTIAFKSIPGTTDSVTVNLSTGQTTSSGKVSTKRGGPAKQAIRKPKAAGRSQGKGSVANRKRK